ncbi:MAG: uncharacterized protein A8A55_1200 [Amphiamblys sp. WSBS2006]|nr:MAG: uncharacterized protein A8A55_1200 [Amphiamblys sp. WSBS2006]
MGREKDFVLLINKMEKSLLEREGTWKQTTALLAEAVEKATEAFLLEALVLKTASLLRPMRRKDRRALVDELLRHREALAGCTHPQMFSKLVKVEEQKDPSRNVDVLRLLSAMNTKNNIEVFLFISKAVLSQNTEEVWHGLGALETYCEQSDTIPDRLEDYLTGVYTKKCGKAPRPLLKKFLFVLGRVSKTLAEKRTTFLFYCQLCDDAQPRTAAVFMDCFAALKDMPELRLETLAYLFRLLRSDATDTIVKRKAGYLLRKEYQQTPGEDSDGFCSEEWLTN